MGYMKCNVVCVQERFLKPAFLMYYLPPKYYPSFCQAPLEVPHPDAYPHPRYFVAYLRMSSRLSHTEQESTCQFGAILGIDDTKGHFVPRMIPSLEIP